MVGAKFGFLITASNPAEAVIKLGRDEGFFLYFLHLSLISIGQWIFLMHLVMLLLGYYNILLHLFSWRKTCYKMKRDCSGKEDFIMMLAVKC